MSPEMMIIPLVVGFVLDAILGDPRAIPHPVVFFGNWISRANWRLNKGEGRKLKGTLTAIGLILITFVIFTAIALACSLNIYTYYVITSFFVFLGVANHGLIKEGLRVHWALEKHGLEAGRKQLSFIVGRDTSQLNAQEIRTAVLETLSENLSDGVIAPIFYYAIGGIPLMFTYKMINTMDSMIGYKSEKYKDFGWFAAKTDDVVNYIPARITALIMVIVTFSFRGVKFILKYGHKHASPNAGYPESALAGILNCRFGGPNVYHGQLMDKPYIGENDRPIIGNDVVKASLVNAGVSVVFVGLAGLWLFYFGEYNLISFLRL